MSAEKEKRESTESWTIKVVEQGLKSENVREVKIDSASKDAISQFVTTSLETIDSRLEKLSFSVEKIKSYGVRRSQREIRDINKQREGDKRKLEAAAKVLRGNTDQVIEFLREGREILGFRIHNLNGTKKD